MMKRYIKTTLLFFTALLLLAEGKAQTIDQSWIDQKEFCIGGKQQLVDIWGEGKSIPNVYFSESLPAFFKRKLLFTEADLQTSKMKWIFTGEQGGITVTVSSDSIEIRQRYYDSFGLNKVVDNKVTAARYPENTFTNFKYKLKDKTISSVTVEINHALALKVYVNDILVNSQVTQIDLSRHQLKIEGSNVNICGKLLVPPTDEATIVINRNSKFQEILGFGGITAPSAYHMLSNEGKAKWLEYLKQYNLLIQREYPIGKKLRPDFSNWDKLEDANPHYYGDNFPNGEISDFAYNKLIQDNGGMVVFEFWQLPDWMNIQRTLDYDKYAEAIVNYCNTAKKKTGKAPAIVGIQNEITQPAKVWQQMTLKLRDALDKNGFKDIRIHMHNSTSLAGGTNALRAFISDKKVWDNIDYPASNLYDYQNYFTNPDGFDELIKKWQGLYNDDTVKPFMSVEMCVNNEKYQSGSYRVAFLMGELYHKNMVDMNAVSLMYCWLLVNNVQPSFSASRSLFTIDENKNNIPTASSFQLRVFGAFSRHIPTGSRRISTSCTDADLMISAYSKGNKNSLIVLNRGTSPKKINISGINNLSKAEVVSPYQENRQLQIDNSGEMIIEPGSILTLY